MNTDEFWQIIDSAHSDSGGDMDRKCEFLKIRLGKLNEQDLKDFIDHFDDADAKAYAWPLWGAAYIMHGGCSDDSFSDFRATLISHGRNIYMAALSDPDSLSDLVFQNEADICYEGFQYVKTDVAEEKFGKIPERGIPFPDKPSGEGWDEDSVNDLYPRLSAKYSFSSAKYSFSNEKNEGRELKKPWWKLW